MLKQLATWTKRLILALGLLVFAVSIGKAAATFGSIAGPSCTLSACTFTATVTAMSNPDKLVCLEYATFDFKNRCNSSNSGGDKTETTGCACVSPACNPTTGVGVWTCSGLPPGTSTIYWAITTWTSGSAGSTCGGEATFGACGTISPLAVALAAFTADATPAGVTLTWETVSEADNAGFNVYRAGSVGDRPEPANWLAFVPSANPGSTAGAGYAYLDTAVVAGQTYWYWLEDVDTTGGRTLHGPVSATVAGPTAVELSGLAAGTVVAGGVPLAAALLALLVPLAGTAWTQRRPS